MFGSVFKMRPKAGKKDELIQLMSQEDNRAIKGFRASYALEAADGSMWGVAVFDDEKTYRANASDPEQDKWYQRMRDMLEANPEWNDGSIHEYIPKG